MNRSEDILGQQDYIISTFLEKGKNNLFSTRDAEFRPPEHQGVLMTRRGRVLIKNEHSAHTVRLNMIRDKKYMKWCR